MRTCACGRSLPGKKLRCYVCKKESRRVRDYRYQHALNARESARVIDEMLARQDALRNRTRWRADIGPCGPTGAGELGTKDTLKDHSARTAPVPALSSERRTA